MPPERPVEEDRDAQVVAGTVVVRDVVRHRAAQALAGPFDVAQPVVGQCDDDRIELLLRDTPGAAGRHDVAVRRGSSTTRTTARRARRGVRVRLAARRRGSISMPPSIEYCAPYPGTDFRKFRSPISPLVRCGSVAMSLWARDLEILPRDRIRHLLQNVRAGARGPGMAVVVAARTRGASSRAAAWRPPAGGTPRSLAACRRRSASPISCSSRRNAPFRTTALLCVGTAVSPSSLISCRSGSSTDRVVGVALRHARLVRDRRGVESAGLNLAAQPAAGLEQRQPAGRCRTLLPADVPSSGRPAHRRRSRLASYRPLCRGSTQEPRGTGHAVSGTALLSACAGRHWPWTIVST